MRLLGIDIGTGGTRAVLTDAGGQVLAAASAEHSPISIPHRGWAEQDPEDWWRAACRAIHECLSRARTPAGEITAIGLTGQMHGLVLLGAAGEVLRPAIIWCDQRTGDQCRTITEAAGAERLIDLTANPALTAFTLPKILWVRDEEPAVWARVRSILLPKDYVRFRLTGALATDVTDASGTLLLDVANRRWSESVLELSKVNPALLPVVHESHQITGHVSDDGSRRIGLAPRIPVVAGAGDQAAGAVAMGIVRAGAVSATIGTSGVVFAATARPFLDPKGRIHTFCHAAPGLWHVMGVTQAAGYSLRWFRDQFGAKAVSTSSAADPDVYDLLTAEAAQAPPGSDGLLWAPYLMGERTPHLDPLARGALVGITSSHTRAHVVRAIMEGVAFSLRDTLTIFGELGLPIESIRLGGGGARSPLWRQIQADVYGMPVEMVTTDEGPAYGAALLAGVGARAWSSLECACEAAVRVAQTMRPDVNAAGAMNRQYTAYRKIYPALRDIAADA